MKKYSINVSMVVETEEEDFEKVRSHVEDTMRWKFIGGPFTVFAGFPTAEKLPEVELVNASRKPIALVLTRVDVGDAPRIAMRTNSSDNGCEHGDHALEPEQRS